MNTFVSQFPSAIWELLRTESALEQLCHVLLLVFLHVLAAEGVEVAVRTVERVVRPFMDAQLFVSGERLGTAPTHWPTPQT
jgi:hypothetical protein